ncbi:hypothetical protein HanIR_Chr12g0612431 [Helianthus annuus]|nr:hypothetical protein HanIR_Chr12g0612431 [Helianthus annuus]
MFDFFMSPYWYETLRTRFLWSIVESRPLHPGLSHLLKSNPSEG